MRAISCTASIANQSKNVPLYTQRQDVSKYPIQSLVLHYLLVQQ